MVRHFTIIWFFYWVSAFFLPIESVNENIIYAFFLQLSFFCLVLFGYGWFELVNRRAEMPVVGGFCNDNVLFLVKASLILSTVGTICLFYDKIFVQGIDYSKGLAVAREAWRKEGVAREGHVSSFFSVVGYLFSSCYFVAAVLIVRSGKNMKASLRYIYLLAVFMLLMANSILAGGCSNVLLLAVFFAAAISSVPEWRFREFFVGKFEKMLVIVLVILSLFYLVFVFSSRAKATGVEPVIYVRDFLPYLGMRFSAWFDELLGQGLVSSIISLLSLTVAYFTHSISTTAAIIEHGVGDNLIVFIHPMNILYKLNLINKPDSSWFLAGRFPSLPGAIYYQLGGYGFFVVSILIGFLGGFTKYIYSIRPRSLIFLSLYLTIYSIMVMSPLLLVIDFMSFPFVFFSFFIVYFIGVLVCAFKKMINS